MATWKEKGVVPDSDDEGDLDSQSTTAFEQELRKDEQQDDGTFRNDIVVEVDELRVEDETDLVGFALSSPGAELPLEPQDASTQSALYEEISPPDSPTRSAKSLKVPSCSSPKELSAFKVPEPFWGWEEEGTPSASPQNLARHFPPQDDISQTYVKLTSLSSSLLSSPPPSQLRRSTQGSPEGSRTASILKVRLEETRVNEGPSTEHLEQQMLQDLQFPPKRSFRQRNLIQLHPYAIEGEKFRQTFKARGLAPVRIAASSQNSNRPKSRDRSVEPDSQEGDSQDVFFESFETQDLDWDPHSSPPERPEPKQKEDDNADEGPATDDEDYEFPDMDGLLKLKDRPPGLPKPVSKPAPNPPRKHGLKTYSTKFKRPPPIDIATRKPRSKTVPRDVQDRPDSPPATCSPLLPPAGRNRQSLSRASSLASSNAPSGSVENDRRRTADLPTPATSAMKPIPDPIFLDSLSDSDDPFASDPENLSPGQSSSDESFQLRKVGKKIRGVLPASHIRLDVQNKKPPPPGRTQRDSSTASPVKGVARKGVALPRDPNRHRSERTSSFAGLEFLSDSSAEDDEDDGGASLSENARLPPLSSIFDESRLGDADEENVIDAMLPSRKRQSEPSVRGPHKKRRNNEFGGTKGQPKITDHLKRPRNPTSLGERRSKRPKTSTSSNARIFKSHAAQPKRPRAPEISILDVVGSHSRSGSVEPQFIKLAARAARSRKREGRQSPSRKFIRLATREDTQDVQSVLEDWRGGRITPKATVKSASRLGNSSRSPLSRIENSQQMKFPLPESKPRSTYASQSGPRRLVISGRIEQQSMRNFVVRQPVLKLPKEVSMLQSALKTAQRARQRLQGEIYGRPAQLESSEMDYSRRNPSAAFRTTKKALDSLYRTSRRRSDPQRNLQLNRFLADEDVVRPSIESGANENPSVTQDQHAQKARPLQKLILQRKRSPKRIDAGAAMYRQPSDPLILDFLVREQNLEDVGDACKLLGLGKFGTKYPVHFDIFPLQQGIFFHQDTWIGSGRLRKAIQGIRDEQSPRGTPVSLRIDDKIFKWASWDETASSEVGVCFDWLAEQLVTRGPPTSTPVVPKSVEVLEFVLDYVQNQVIFDGLLSETEFLSRFLQVIRDFTSHLNGIANRDTLQLKQVVEVLSLCTILAFSLLRHAQTDPESSTLVYEFEDLLKHVASRCIMALLSEGLENIRALYDNLQYLSFRESGIKKDQYAANSWVTLIQVLGAARIPRGNFWDVFNSQLDLSSIRSILDAPALEKLWYTMYTLLPLCEFDQCGFVPGIRQTTSLDNWILLQNLLQRVFSLYRSNQRQYPGFNDYCRAIVSRCHYLMTEWGWWRCGGIIGTLFDFFAEQKLSHLRNEEVYHSPRFLEELDQEPSLEVESEDRCFHVFLKIVALGIKHLHRINDGKSVRNLVARLLPNHDRQFPKEEDVHIRDLASLRNHHNLLCTLYWTALPDQRPSLSLIQELVIPDRSHTEACLISLRAWENLARFLATRSPDVNAYQPFKAWQSSFFNAVSDEYLQAEQEVRQQAEVLQRQGGDATSDSRISDAIRANRRSIIVTMCRSMNAMANTIKAATTDSMTKQVLNSDVLAKALDPAIYNDKSVSRPFLDEVMLVLCNYMEQSDRFCPVLEASSARAANEDSQDSLDMAEANWGRLEMAVPLNSIAEKFAPVVRKFMEVDLSEDNPTANLRLLDCWARLVAILTEDKPQNLRSFLISDHQAVFENRPTFKLANEYWPLFLAKIIEYRKTLDGFPPGFNIGLEWLLALTRAQQISTPETMLTLQLCQRNYYLCNVPDLYKSARANIIRFAIRKMSTLLLEENTDTDIGISHKDAKRLFSDMLGEIMKSMQQVLECLDPTSNQHKTYLEFARAVVTNIKCYANEFRPLTDYFIHPSTSYWPSDDDPNLYAAGIISYCIRLGQQPQRTSFELFYYLHGGWKNALISGNMQNYTSHIKKGLKRWEFSKFIFSEFVPAILDAGFNAGGWLLCQSFLPAFSSKIRRLLDKLDGNTTWVFEHMINILKIIMNGTNMWARNFGHNIQAVHPDHRGILCTVYKFWFSVAPCMRQYIERHPELTADLEEVTDPLSSFIYNSLQTFSTGELEPPFPLSTGQFDTMKGKYTDKFTAVMVQDIQEHWSFVDEDGFAVIVRNRGKEKSDVQVVRDTLGEVLGGEVAGYEALFEDKESIELPSRVGEMTMDLFF